MFEFRSLEVEGRRAEEEEQMAFLPCSVPRSYTMAFVVSKVSMIGESDLLCLPIERTCLTSSRRVSVFLPARCELLAERLRMQIVCPWGQ